MSAGTTRESVASTASLGTARAGPPVSPSAEAVKDSWGTATMS